MMPVGAVSRQIFAQVASKAATATVTHVASLLDPAGIKALA